MRTITIPSILRNPFVWSPAIVVGSFVLTLTALYAFAPQTDEAAPAASTTQHATLTSAAKPEPSNKDKKESSAKTTESPRSTSAATNYGQQAPATKQRTKNTNSSSRANDTRSTQPDEAKPTTDESNDTTNNEGNPTTDGSASSSTDESKPIIDILDPLSP